MAHKLEEFFSIRYVEGGVEVICEIDTSHTAKKYYLMEARGAHIQAQESASEGLSMGARPPMLQMKVCIICLVTYMRYIGDRISEYPSDR